MELFKTKQTTKFVVLINILLIGFLLGILVSFNVNGISDFDITYTFENNVLFEQDDTEFYADFNTREYEVWEHDGVFNATYSFENDINGETPVDFDYVSGTGIHTVIASLDGHKKIYQIDDTGTDNYITEQVFIDKVQISGIIEWWWRTDNAGTQTEFRFYDGTTRAFRLVIVFDVFKYENINTGITCLNNTWYHHKLEFDCNTDTCSWYIDDVLAKDDVAFQTEVDSISKIQFRTSGSPPFKSWYDAIGYYFGDNYTGEHFDVIAQDNSPKAITWDGESFWIVGDTNDKVHEYYANGTYTGTYFDVSSQDIAPRGICWDGESFWIVGGYNTEVYQYNSTYDYTGVHFNTGTQDVSSCGITWNGEYFWFVGSVNKEVYKYYANGSYTGAHFYVGTQDTSPKGITWDGESFWITGDTNDKIYKYYVNGTYSGFNFDVGTQDNIPTGITYNNTHFFVLGAENNEVYSYKLLFYTGYEIGDNLQDTFYLESSGTEVDKWEFTHKGLFEHFDDGDDNPNGWTDLEDGEDDVNCKVYGVKNNMLNGIVELYANSGEQLGLYKDNLGYSEDIALNVSFGFEIKYIYSILHNDVYLEVYSSDDTEIVRIRIYNTGELKYWVSGTTYTQLTTGFVIDTNYDVNLEINYITDKCTLKYTTDGIFTDSFEFPLTATGKTGLKQVRFRICADTDYAQVYLDYIGIYINGRSISTEYAYIGLHVSDHSYWHFEEFNILSIDIIGNGISIYLTNAYYVSQMSPSSQPEEISSAYDYTEKRIYNVYDFLYDDYWGRDYIWGGVLWFLFNDTFKFKETLIEGVKMVEDENEYSLEFTHSGVNIIDNYFYVLNNKLYFSQTSDDENLEYIQATFNVENVLTENYSISYSSVLSGNAYCHLRVFYTDITSTLLSLRSYTAAPNVILPQDKTIFRFDILITDNDNDNIEGTTTGYITSIKLIHLVGVSINIITITLLSIMIPLLILIIPTFLIYLRFGKSAIIPVFVLMTFICFITNLIPLWLFFIILLSCGAFMITKKITTEKEG